MKELFTEVPAFKTDIKSWGGGAFGLIPSPSGVDASSYWWGNGIIFNDRDCAGAGSHNACEIDPKCDPGETSIVKQTPFTIYTNLQCDVDEGLDDAVLNALLYKTPWVLSGELETAPSRASIVTPLPSTVTNPGIVDISIPVSVNSYDIVTAVSNLVFNRDANEMPFSIILLPSWMEVLWGDRPKTTENYRLVFLPGWQGLEPVTGNEPAVGTGWITALSNVEYLVDEPKISSAFDQTKNLYTFYAKRQGILRFSVCNVYSILVGA